MNTSIATSDLRQLGFVISRAAWGKKPSNMDNVLHVCMWVLDNMQTGHACLRWPSSVPIVFAPRLGAHRRADHSVSLQSLSCQCSGSHAAIGRSLVNCLGDRSWGSKWSSLPSPSPWQRLDSPAGIRCWPARGVGPWSPKRGHGHLTPRMWDTQPFQRDTQSQFYSESSP